KVGKYTLDGKELFQCGPAERPSDTGGYDGRTPASVTKAGGPFNRPTNAAVAPDGDVFVSDGYGNTRIHRFSPRGELCASCGAPECGHSAAGPSTQRSPRG